MLLYCSFRALGTVRLFSRLALAKAPLPSDVTFCGSTTSVRLVHELKALAPMMRNDFGREIEMRLKQP